LLCGTKDWAKNHKLAQLTDKIKYDIALKVGTAFTVKIPDSICSWTTEHFIAFLKSVEVRDFERYKKEIEEHIYDGKWLWRRKNDEKLLSVLFPLKSSDAGDVMLELEKWVNDHQQ